MTGWGAGAPTVSFTGNPVSGAAPLPVAFTDSSSGSPTGWTWFFGDENFTEPWTQMTAGAGWGPRDSHSTVALLDGSIVLTGGYGSGIGYKNDAWRSTDKGATWTQMTASAGWSARLWHSTVAMPDGSIVLTGGADSGGTRKNDVWRSTDNGATWTQMTPGAGWSGRDSHNTVALPDGSIVLMGGRNALTSGFKNDVWRSTDNGATWTQMTPGAGWSPRHSQSSVAMPDGSIVLTGGLDSGGNRKNDVWRSTDNGATWTEMNTSAGWAGRAGHSSVAMPDGSIVLMGGNDGTVDKNDLWRSTDNGATWTEVSATAGWPARHSQSRVALPDGSIVLTGGSSSIIGYVNDVWRFNPVGSSVRNPSHTYLAPGSYHVTLQAFNTLGYNNLRKTGYVTVTASPPAPVAGFTGTPLAGTAPLGVSFTDTTTGSPTGWAWYFGDENYSVPTWTEQSAGAGWTARWRQSSVALPDGSIVLMGGYDGSTYRNDVWRSTDKGATWTRQTAGAGWSPRTGHSSVALPDGSIVLMGGYDGAVWLNDVWRSTDNGATWTEQTPGAGWTARNTQSSVVMPDGSIVLMGGWDGSAYRNDVWRSTDKGATWTRQTAGAGWPARELHTSVALPDGSIVLMGGWNGAERNDVWRSTDNGAAWTEQNASAGWLPRSGHSSVAMPDGSIVLMGGGDPGFANDVWRSTDDGATWAQVTAGAGWSARFWYSGVALPDSSIVIMGGRDSSGPVHDVWRFSPAGSLLRNPTHTYTVPGIYQVALQAYNAGGYTSMRRAGYVSVTPPTGLPIVSFTGAPATGTAPLQVTFNDTSEVVTPLMWNWSFGDASLSWFNTTDSTSRNATYLYTGPGTYTVSLTVTNASGSTTATRAGYITVTASAAPGSTGTSLPDSDSLPVSSGMVTLPGILKGSTGTFAFSPVISGSSLVGISRVRIITSSDVGEITVIILPVLPGAFQNPPDPPVAGFEEVKAIGISPAALDYAVITFGVDGSWLTTNHLTSGDVVILQDANGQWTDLPTTFDYQDGNRYYFDATVHGFGDFAVGGRANTGTTPVESIVPVASIVPVVPVVPVVSAAPVVPAAPEAASPPATVQNPPAGIPANRPVLPSSPYIPSRFAPIAAVIVGIFVCVISSLIRESEFFNRYSGKVTTLFKSFMEGEASGLMSSTEISKRGVRPRENLTPVFLGLSWREILVTGITALGFTAAFFLQGRLEIQLTTLIIFLCTGALASILHDLAHKHVAYRTGSITEYQFWGLGTVTMLATAWFFGNAFAKPSRTVIRSIGEPTPEEDALVRLAGPLVSMAMALASLLLIPFGGFYAIAGSAGFSMNLLNCVFSLVPVKPNDGVEVFRWNKAAWAAIFIPLIAFYLYIYLQ